MDSSNYPWIVANVWKMTTSTSAENSIETAREFLNAVSLNGTRFAGIEPQDVVFRGVGDRSYRLLPTALRSPANTWRLQALRECEDLISFLEAADQEGLAVPEDSINARQMLEFAHMSLTGKLGEAIKRFKEAGNPTRDQDGEPVQEVPLVWPLPNFLAPLAVAQHYGMPTQLLDWSRSPLVAAYFAATSAVRQMSRNSRPGKSDQRLAVWALRLDHPAVRDAQIRPLDGAATLPRVLLVQPPTAGIPNLRAQKGLFTLVLDIELLSQMRRWEESVQGHALDDSLEQYGGREALVHLTLPQHEAPELLRLLYRQGISAATLFPGFAGAAKLVAERRTWEPAQ